MRANMGDRIPKHGTDGSDPAQVGEVIEVHGADGGPPYLVRYTDGHETLVFPGPDCVILPPAPQGHGPAALSTRLTGGVRPAAETA
ncbi:DUF1918 domain-containing protein [Streptomyces sp. NPDC012461]|uniref:DUF1918 domain-containing protein n=2 Tax=unclassified Streptomyces TaxID=2593676 RepID=UPI0019621119|nr:DUF1918 domain-containing protein [Streptomyces sp. S12]